MADSECFSCDFCSASYQFKKGLKRHYEKIHKGMKIPASFYDLKEKRQVGVCTKCGSTYTHKWRHACPSKAPKKDVVVFQNRTLRSVQDQSSSSSGIKDQGLENEEEEFRRFLCSEDCKSLDDVKLTATTITKYMSILKKWKDFAKVPSLLELPPTLGEFGDSLESTGSRFMAYIISQHLLKFAAAKGSGYGLGYKPTIGDIINCYLDSDSRKETMTNFSLSFFGVAGVEKARNFAMAEVLLSTKSLEFLQAMTVPTFELGLQTEDGKWKFCIEGKDESFLENTSIPNILMPNDVHNLIVLYIKEIRPIFFPSSGPSQSIKIFSIPLGGAVNLDQVANLKGACKFIEDIAESFLPLTLENVLTAEYTYKGTS